MSASKGSVVRLVDVIVCDDVRVERNGKLLLIGVYLGNILCEELPTLLPTLSFVTKWNTEKGQAKKGVYRFLDPSGAEVASTQPQIPPNSERKPFHVSISQFVPMRLRVSGSYRWTFCEEGGRIKTLAKISVRLADRGVKHKSDLDAN